MLQSLYGQLSIPPAVNREVFANGFNCPGAAELRFADWIDVIPVDNIVAVQLLRERLDLGESEAIILAIQLKSDLLLIDEAKGRRVAQAQDLTITGTLGTLLLAEQYGLIPSAVPLVEQLMAAGFYMSQELYQTIKKLSNEATQ